MEVEKYSIQYCVPELQPVNEPEVEEFPSVSYFMGRLVMLLDDPTVEIREFQMGRRKATLCWGGTVELP